MTSGSQAVGAVKARLRAGEVAVVVTPNFAHAGLFEFLGNCGFDGLVLDGEHGVSDDRDVEDLARACELTGASSIVRVPANRAAIERYLAMGIDGIHAPQVQTVAEAEYVVAAVKFPPHGERGLGNFRATRYGVDAAPWPEMMARANDETVVVVAVEDQSGLAAVEEICQLPDIDVVLVGPTDLSCALGVPGETQHPTVLAAIEAAAATVNAAGKALGLPARTPDEVRTVVDRGARYILTSLTRSTASTLTALASAAR